MAPIDPAVLSKWLAWTNLVAGVVMFAVGWRARGRTGELSAPVGAMLIVGGVSHFLWGTVSDAVMIAVDLIAMAAMIAWSVRLHRASRARIRELRKRRDASQSWR